MAELPLESTPAQVKKMVDEDVPLLIVDVREQQEYQICRIEGAELIPMNTIPQRLQYLDGVADERVIVVHCHHGMRSLNVVTWLRQQGVTNCTSMSGGIEQWSTQIDPAVPRY